MLVVSPTSLNFGTLGVGTTSSAQTLTVYTRSATATTIAGSRHSRASTLLLRRHLHHDTGGGSELHNQHRVCANVSHYLHRKCGDYR